MFVAEVVVEVVTAGGALTLRSKVLLIRLNEISAASRGVHAHPLCSFVFHESEDDLNRADLCKEKKND